MLGMFRKGRKKSSLLLHLVLCASLLAALVYGFGVPRDDVAGHFWQLLIVMAIFIVLALIPAALLIWIRRRRRRSNPLYPSHRDHHR